MYQQGTATVDIFLKFLTTDSLVFSSENISRTAILTQASVITCKQNFQSFSCIGFNVKPLLFHFSKINLKSDQCLLLMVSLLDYQGIKSCKSTESFCLSILTIYTNNWSTVRHVYWCHVYFFFCEIPKYVQTKNRLAHLDWDFMKAGQQACRAGLGW